MAKVFEFSDGFDAVAWHLERMAQADHDDYYEEDQGQPLPERGAPAQNHSLRRCYKSPGFGLASVSPLCQAGAMIKMIEDTMMCVYCDSEVASPFCVKCMEYKGVMNMQQWEEYTNLWGY